MTMICGIILAAAFVAGCDRKAVTTVVVKRSITVAGSPTAVQAFRRSVATATPRRLNANRMQADVIVPVDANRALVDAIANKAGNLDLDYWARETRTVTTSPSWHVGFDVQPQRS